MYIQRGGQIQDEFFTYDYYENRDLLGRSLFSWTWGFGLVRLYQLESGLCYLKSHVSFFVKIQQIRLEKTKNRFCLQLWFGMTLFLC